MPGRDFNLLSVVEAARAIVELVASYLFSFVTLRFDFQNVMEKADVE